MSIVTLQRCIKRIFFLTILTLFYVPLQLATQKNNCIAPHRINNNIREEKPIVVVIPSYNNKEWHKQNLDSVFMQNYTNYRIIYIDDASPDGTGQLVEAYIKACGQAHRVTLIQNKQNRGALANHYTAAHLCQDHEILVHLDGDDFFAHPQVLQRINKAYSDPNVWITYGQYEELYYSKDRTKSNTKTGFCKEIPPNIVRAHAYREDTWVSSHLRTCYAGLFKQIKLQDLLEHGDFYHSACDYAFMFPLLEMAAGKFKFIDEILYQYNCSNSLNIYKTKLQKQLHNAHAIRAKEKYAKVATPFRTPKTNRADLVIIAEHSPEQLYAHLESVFSYLCNIHTIYVVYHMPTDTKNLQEIHQLAHDFETIHVIPTNDIKSSLQQILSQSQSTYTLLTKDTILLKNFINIETSIMHMEQTYAYGFYFALGKNIQYTNTLTRTQTIPPCIELTPEINAWQFQDGEHDWRNPNNFLMTLYHTKDILTFIQDIPGDSTKNFEAHLNKQPFDMEQVGLFFADSKAVELIPLANTKPPSTDKLTPIPIFDIRPLFLLKNSSILLKKKLSYKGSLNNIKNRATAL